jgi:hypothetical protein
VIHPAIPLTLRNGKFFAVTPESAEMEGFSAALEKAGRPYDLYWDGFENGFVINITSDKLVIPGMQLIERNLLDDAAKQIDLLRRESAWNYINEKGPEIENILQAFENYFNRQIDDRHEWGAIIASYHARRVVQAAHKVASDKRPEELSVEDEQTLFTAGMFLKRALKQ